MPNYMTQRQIAQKLGYSDAYISKAIRQGKIKKIIDPTDGRAKLDFDEVSKILPKKNNKTDEPQKEQKNKNIPNRYESEAIERFYKAKMIALKYKILEKKVIDKDKLENELYEFGRGIRNELQNAIKKIAIDINLEFGAEIDQRELELTIKKHIDLALENTIKRGLNYDYLTEIDE